MDGVLMLYVKMLIAGVIGWKLGVLERKIEKLINEMIVQQSKKEYQ